MNQKSLKQFLDEKVSQYNTPAFIKHDPIFIPHQFSKKQDIEIAGFFSAIFSWGNRTSIIKKGVELMQLMDDAPHDFIINHQLIDLKKLIHFKHRTFNTTDLLYFVEFFRQHYHKHDSLEDAFVNEQSDMYITEGLPNAEAYLTNFYNQFFALEYVPQRTRKHISTPYKKSACKRINMFLRWMVRNDGKGVDFGIWKQIKPVDLICPLDLHVARVAKHFNILQRNNYDWLAAVELTDNLRKLDAEDPVKYDFALFGLGVTEKF
ncbi:TIGR02757 family protein [soil metagenome]